MQTYKELIEWYRLKSKQGPLEAIAQGILDKHGECEKLKEQAKLVTPAQNEMSILKTKLEFYEMVKPITEHPDVQKLIAKMVVLQAKYAALLASHAKLVEALKRNRDQAKRAIQEWDAETVDTCLHYMERNAEQALAEAEEVIK